MPANDTKNVTLKDVAMAAGVSVNAASRALRDMPDIGADTKERVREVANRLGYRKNQAAARLRTNRSRQIGVITGDIMNPFVGAFLQGICKACDVAGYGVMLSAASNSYQKEEEYIRSFIENGVDGILFHPSDRPQSSVKPVLDMLEGASCPVLFSGSSYLDVGGSYVIIDDIKGGQLVAEHLYQLGHRKFGLLSPTASVSSPMTGRPKGFKDYLAAQGLDPEECVYHPYWNPTSCDPSESIEKLVEHIDDMTAIFCYCDYYAGELYAALQDAGIRIPQDISIVGFDDLKMCKWLNPSLTSVRFDSVAFGEISARELIQIIESPYENKRIQRQVVFGPQLISRGSTAAPRKERLIHPARRSDKP